MTKSDKGVGMADFFRAFGYLIEDVFGQELSRTGLSKLPLAKLGAQANLWCALIEREGWSEDEFDLVFRECYRTHLWQVLRGDEIHSQPIADSLFRYASFTHCRHTIRLMQAVLGMCPTGDMSRENIIYLNLIDEETFYCRFSERKLDLISENLHCQGCEVY
jgi:hypothetical protein